MGITILYSLEFDIISINETHHSHDLNIKFNNYSWFSNCRRTRHKNANVTHGGVGIFVNNELLNNFSVSIVDNTFDGILLLLLQHKLSEYCFIFGSCYMPPEGSPWIHSAENFLGHLLGQLYLLSYVDDYIICGDFNARTSDLSDVLGCDNISISRSNIDKVKNSHGEALIDFLHE